MPILNKFPSQLAYYFSYPKKYCLRLGPLGGGCKHPRWTSTTGGVPEKNILHYLSLDCACN